MAGAGAGAGAGSDGGGAKTETGAPQPIYAGVRAVQQRWAPAAVSNS